MTGAAAFAVCGAVLCFYAFFYKTVVKRWGPLVQPLVDRLVARDRHPSRQVDAVGKLAAAALAQSAFALFLAAVLASGFERRVRFAIRADALVLGGLIGFAELALASLLCTAFVRLSVLSSADCERAAREWTVQGRGGWMRQFAAAVRIAPPWFAVLVIGLYVSVEEIVFRGILIELLRPFGGGAAVGLSACLFVAVQSFHMPGARAAMFPVTGAAIIGLTHGVLYWQLPDLSPLVVAHLTFFAAALGLGKQRDGEAWYPQ